jgi:hypothetical protein
VLTSEDERRYGAIPFAAALVRARGAVDDAAFAAARAGDIHDGM